MTSPAIREMERIADQLLNSALKIDQAGGDHDMVTAILETEMRVRTEIIVQRKRMVCDPED